VSESREHRGPSGPFAARDLERADDAAVREAGHQRLAELLAAHADGELPPETASQLDAHLVGCDRCRGEMRVHVAIRERLAAEPLLPASPALLARITSAVRARPEPVARPTPAPGGAREPATRWILAHRRLAATFTAAFVAVALLAVSATSSRFRGTPALDRGAVLTAGTAPLLAAVLDDYRRVAARDLPGRARDLAAVRAAVPFPVEPLRDRQRGGRQLRLLGAWTTSLAGEPAAVLAYRWDDRLLLQYVVPEHLFFRHPAVRSAVAGGRLLAAADGAQRLVAWPEAAAGSLLVGDAGLEQLATVRADAGPR